MGYPCSYDEGVVEIWDLTLRVPGDEIKMNESMCGCIYKYRYILSNEYVEYKNEWFI